MAFGLADRDQLTRHRGVLAVMARTAITAMTATLAVLAALPVIGGSATARAAVASCANLPATTLDHAVPWAQRMLGFERAWPITEGAGVTVAVVDSGVDASQPFLRGAVLPGVDIVHGSGPASIDCDGHGTFIAGIIAGRQLAGFGFAGVAPRAEILPIRQANSAGQGTALTLAEGIRAAVDRHASVINVSVVTGQPTLALAQAVRYALARNVVIVAAAGNDFSQGNAVQYPAGFPGVLAVGAVDASGQRAVFSEAGPNVSVVAPGTDLLGPGAGGVGLVSSAGGTSFATAFVSGVAALVRSYYPDLTAAEVISRIEATADHPPGPLPTAGLGWGIVDPYAAVTAVLPGPAGSPPPPTEAGYVPPPPPARPGSAAGDLAIGTAAGGSALAVGILLAAGVLRRGRQRRWQPASWLQAPAASGSRDG